MNTEITRILLIVISSQMTNNLYDFQRPLQIAPTGFCELSPLQEGYEVATERQLSTLNVLNTITLNILQ